MIDIVCFSQNNWEKRWARKQHLMHKFSQHENVRKVLYIEPAVTLFRLLLNPFKELNTKAKRSRWKRALLSKEYAYSDSLYIYTVIALLPFSWKVYGIYRLNSFLSLFFQRFEHLYIGISQCSVGPPVGFDIEVYEHR